jgi:hypothetical protein
MATSGITTDPTNLADRRLAAPAPEAPTDPFDLGNLRLSQDFSRGGAVAKKLLTVPVRKPAKTDFVRVHRDPAYALDALVLELKDQRGECYLVGRRLQDQLAAESAVKPMRLVTAVNRQGVVFLWPLRLPGPDGREDDWMRSALEIADLAKDSWVRVVSNLSLGAYEPFVATADYGDPAWPRESFDDLARVAFAGKVIGDWGHPVLKALRGEL